MKNQGKQLKSERTGPIFWDMKTTDSRPRDWREGRRIRAWELKQEGWKQRDIATALGVSEGAVSQWMRRAREAGVEGLRHPPPQGAPSRLSAEQRRVLLDMLSRGADAFGFPDPAWTGPRAARLIYQYFGVSYHPNYVTALLQDLGWAPRKASRRQGRRRGARRASPGPESPAGGGGSS